MENSTETQTAEVTKEMKGNLVVSFNKPTPKWATWIFRIVFCLTTAATMILTAEPAIADDLKVRIFLYLKVFDFVIWFIGRGIGIEKTDFENEVAKTS